MAIARLSQKSRGHWLTLDLWFLIEAFLSLFMILLFLLSIFARHITPISLRSIYDSVKDNPVALGTARNYRRKGS